MNGKNLFSNSILVLILFLALFNEDVLAQWSQINLLQNKSINDILISNNGYIFIAGENSGLYRSINNLSSWEQANNGLPSPNVNIIKVFSSNNNLFVKITGGLFRSSNYGNRWDLIKSDTFDRILLPVGYYYQKIFAVNLSISKSFTSVYFSSDNGESWLPTDAGVHSKKANCLIAQNNSLFLGTKSGVYKSIDEGKNWFPVNNGLVRNIEAIAEMNNYLFVSTGNVNNSDSILTSIYYSTNNGQSWQPQDVGSHLTTTAIGEYNGLLVRGAFYGGVQFLSTPGGHFQDGGFPPWHTANCFGIKRDTLLVGEEYYSFQSGTGGVWLYLFPPTGIQDEDGNKILNNYQLHQNYPNPFNPSTKISFDLKNTTHVQLIVYDLLGREIMVLVNEHLPAGSHTVNFQADGLPNGVYVYSLKSGTTVINRKMIHLK